ncbi:MAG TPA: glutaredoxin 3 [Gammaproteobacteria bacterium]|nr:glutaredoxin 3 [Gammaproteobacteria bacterium]
MADERVVVYSQPFCGYCSAAKRLLTAKGAAFTEIDVMFEAGRRDEMIERSGGRRTVPQIFIDGRHIGGYDDLSALDKAGELDGLLSSTAP